MKRYNIAEAKAHLSELIDAALRGEEVIIARRDVPLVRLTVVEAARARPEFGRLAGRITLRSDFEEPLDDLSEYR